jgi:hypothetical protein
MNGKENRMNLEIIKSITRISKFQKNGKAVKNVYDISTQFEEGKDDFNISGLPYERSIKLYGVAKLLIGDKGVYENKIFIDHLEKDADNEVCIASLYTDTDPYTYISVVTNTDLSGLSIDSELSYRIEIN